VAAGLFTEPSMVSYTAIIYAGMIAYFALYSRHHLVVEALKEEEFCLDRVGRG
jgi:ethanolamine permease